MNNNCEGDFLNRFKYRCFWDGTEVKAKLKIKKCPNCKRKIDATTKRPAKKLKKDRNIFNLM